MLVSKIDLEQGLKILKPKSSNKDLSFGLMYLMKEFQKSESELIANISLEKNELGINAFYFDIQRKNFYIYSYLWSDNYKAFKNSMQLLIQKGMESIFSIENTNQQFLKEIRGVLYENKDLINKIFIHFIFTGDSEKAGNSATLSSLREDLESKKYLIDSYFNNRDVSLTVDFLSNENKRKSGFRVTNKSYKFELNLNNHLEKISSENHRLLLGFLKLSDLYKIYMEMGQRLFEKNIRSGLSPDNGPNRAIRKSLKAISSGTLDPVNFTFHHNGITLSAEHISIRGNTLTLTEPRILNGAQTVTSTAKFIDESSTPKSPMENNKFFTAIEVLGKIILPDSSQDHSEFISGITINTNRQNPVEPWNLRASDLLQLDFSDKFKDELGVYYERQENAFDSLTEDELEGMGIAQNKSIQIKKLAQTFLIVQGELDKVHKLREIFEDEKKYQSTFKRKYLDTPAGTILLLYKVQFRLGSVVRTIIENSPEKYYDLSSKSKNIIWSLLLQGLLNDTRLVSYSESYGKSLVIEADFNEILKNLGLRKIKPLLQEIYRSEKYEKNLQESNFSFLRNKATYEHLSVIATEKFGWQKKDL